MKSPFTTRPAHRNAGVAASLQPSRHSLRDGTAVIIRPIQGGDVELERDFIERLSPKSRRFRFLGSIKTPSAEMLRQFTQPQLSGGVAFVALLGKGPATQEIGVCRYSSGEDAGSRECAVVVSDDWQGKGLATLLMHRLIESARSQGFQHMYSIDAADNVEMRQLAGHLGFTCAAAPDDSTLVVHTLALHDPSNAAAPAAATS